jgi:hypothetical protein
MAWLIRWHLLDDLDEPSRAYERRESRCTAMHQLRTYALYTATLCAAEDAQTLSFMHQDAYLLMT